MTRDGQIALLTTLTLPFFYTSGTLHTRHIHASFELWGRPFCSSLLVSFFQCCYERNSIHTISLSHFISLVRSAPHLFFFFLSSRGRLLDSRKRRLFPPHIQHALVVSLNDEPRLAHQRQQLRALPFHFTTYICYSLNIWGVSSWLKQWTAESKKASSNSDRAITFTSGKIPLGNILTPLSSQLWLNSATVTYWSSTQPSIEKQMHPVEDIKI